MHPSQPKIDRLYALSRQATRLRHLNWAAHLEFEAITLKRTARHELWLAELSPKERRRLGMEDKMTTAKVVAIDILEPSNNADVSAHHHVEFFIGRHKIRVSIVGDRLSIDGDRPLDVRMRVSNHFNIGFAP